MNTPKSHTTKQTKQDLADLISRARNQLSLEGATVSPTVYKRILNLAKELSEEELYGEGLMMISWHYLSKRQFNTSLLYITECLRLSNKLNIQRWLPRLYDWSGYIHKAKGDFSNAIDFYELEINANTKLDLEKDNIVAYQVLGNIFDELENHKVAESYFLKAKSIAEKYPNYREVINNLAQVNLSLIGIMSDSQRNTEAKKLAYETLKFVETHKSIPRETIQSVYDTLSHAYYNSKDYNKSVEYALKADSYPIKKHPLISFSICRVLSYNYDALKNIVEAQKYYKKSLVWVNKIEGEYNSKVEIIKRAIVFYEKQNLRKEAQTAYSLLDKVEAEQQTLRSKLNLRYRTAISYENVTNDITANKVIRISTIHNGIVDVKANTINVCYTENGLHKNVTKILVTKKSEEIRTRKSLKTLFDTINHDNFVWIDRNVFINKTYVSDWEQVAQKGSVNIAGKIFTVSRSKRKELFNKHIKTHTA